MRIVRGGRIPLRNLLLLVPAAACFVESARVPTLLAWGSSLGGILTGTMGFWLLLWALAVDPHPIPVIVSGYLVGGMIVGYDLGLVGDSIWWALAILVAGACFYAWKKIEKLWKRDE